LEIWIDCITHGCPRGALRDGELEYENSLSKEEYERLDNKVDSDGAGSRLQVTNPSKTPTSFAGSPAARRRQSSCTASASESAG